METDNPGAVKQAVQLGSGIALYRGSPWKLGTQGQSSWLLCKGLKVLSARRELSK